MTWAGRVLDRARRGSVEEWVRVQAGCAARGRRESELGSDVVACARWPVQRPRALQQGSRGDPLAVETTVTTASPGGRQTTISTATQTLVRRPHSCPPSVSESRRINGPATVDHGGPHRTECGARDATQRACRARSLCGRARPNRPSPPRHRRTTRAPGTHGRRGS